MKLLMKLLSLWSWVKINVSGIQTGRTELDDFEIGSIHGVSFNSDSNRIIAASKSGSLSVIVLNDERLDEMWDEADSESSSEASD